MVCVGNRCGGQRELLIKSFLCHPIVMYSLAAFFVFMINTFLVKHTGRLGFPGYPVTITVYIGVGLLLGQWVIRNILAFFCGITVL